MDREGRRGQDDEEFIKKIAEMLGIHPDKLRNDPSFLNQFSQIPPELAQMLGVSGGPFQSFKDRGQESSMEKKSPVAKNPSSNIKLPEIHPLASAEAHLNLVTAHCNMCKTKSVNAGLLRKGLGGVNTDTEKSNAILYAGKMTGDMMNYRFFNAGRTIEDIMNNEFNDPTSGYVSLVYAVIRPYVAKLFEGLDKYGTDEGMHEFLTRIVSDSNLDNIEGSPVKQAVEAINDRKSGPRIVDKLYIGMLSSFYDLLKSVDRQTFNSELREISNNMKNYLDEAPVSQIISNMSEFIGGCSNTCGYSDADCPGYREKLTASRELLNKAEDDALLLYGDVLCVISYMFDVAASVSGNLSDEEFDNAKLKLYELFRD